MTFHRSISLGSYRRMKSEVVREEVGFWKKRPLAGRFENFAPKRFTISQIHVLCANFVKFGRPEIGCIIYLTKKIGPRSRSRFCADRAQNLSGSAPDNILGTAPNFIQIRSLPAELYSRTRECRSNAPQSISNTRRSFSFFAE